MDVGVGQAAEEDTRWVGARRIGLSGWKETGVRRMLLQDGEWHTFVYCMYLITTYYSKSE